MSLRHQPWVTSPDRSLPCRAKSPPRASVCRHPFPLTLGDSADLTQGETLLLVAALPVLPKAPSPFPWILLPCASAWLHLAIL